MGFPWILKTQEKLRIIVDETVVVLPYDRNDHNESDATINNRAKNCQAEITQNSMVFIEITENNGTIVSS